MRDLPGGGFQFVSNRVTFQTGLVFRTTRRACAQNKTRTCCAAPRYAMIRKTKKGWKSHELRFYQGMRRLPALRVADCPYNAQKTIEAMQQAAEDGCQLTVFPELGLTATPAAIFFCSSRFSTRQKPRSGRF